MTSSSGNIFRVTGHLCGEFTGPGEFHAQRPVTRSFDVFLICARINNWVNNRKAGDLMRRHLGHYDVIVMGRPHTWMVAPTAPPHYTHCILRMYTDKCGTKWNDKNIAIHNCVVMITNWNNKWENWQTLAHCFQFSLINTALLKIDIIKSTLNKCNLYW